MAKLNWGAAGQRFYEAGADRGVLYPNGGPGVAWSGLVSVEEKSNGGSPQPFFVDGFKYANVAEASEFEASLSALSAPSEFGVCDGTVSLANGLFATEQPRQSFGLSYRTLIGNETEGLEKGYKLHLVYNALAAPSSRSHATLSDSPEALSLSWELSTKPVRLPGAKPTAHLVIDSTRSDPHLLSMLEGILYGSEGVNPRLPSPAELVTLFGSWTTLALIGNLNFMGAYTSKRTFLTNYAVNPSGERVQGTWVVRTNLVPNPSFETDASGIVKPTHVTVVRASNVRPERIGSYLLAVQVGETVSGATYVLQSIGAVTPGSYVGFSALVGNSTGSQASRAAIQFLKDGVWGDLVNGPIFAPLRAANLDRIYASGVVPEGATQARVLVYSTTSTGGTASPNSVLLTDAWIAVTAPTEADALREVSQYFDSTNKPAYRKNLATNAIPRVVTEYSYQLGTGEASTSTVVTNATDGPAPEVKSYIRRTIDTPKSGNGSGFFSYNRAQASMAIGSTYIASVYIRPSVSISVQLATSGRSGTTAVGGATSTEYVTIPANVWTRLVGEPFVVNTAGADGVGWWGVVHTNSIIPAGGTLDVSAVLVEETDVVKPYFDGNHVDAFWSGTVASSASCWLPNGLEVRAGSNGVSELYGLNPTGWLGSSDPKTRGQSADGSYYVRATNSGGWGLYIDPSYTAFTADRPLVVGDYVYLAFEASVTHPVAYMRARIAGYNGVVIEGGIPDTTSLTPEDGWVRFSTSAKIVEAPVGGSPGGYIRTLAWPADLVLPTDAELRVRKMTVLIGPKVEGEVPLFDGSSNQAIYLGQPTTTNWMGEVGNSTSRLWYESALPTTPSEGDALIIRKDQVTTESYLWYFSEGLWQKSLANIEP